MNNKETNQENSPAVLERKKKILELVKKSRNDFYTYVLLMAPTLMPGEFKTGRHIELLCNELQEMEKETSKAFEGKKGSSSKMNEKAEVHYGKRLQVSLPPGSSKSTICGQLFPSWIMGRHPTWRILVIGHGQEFAQDNFGRPIRDIVKSNEFKAIFPKVWIRSDVSATARFQTNHRGIVQVAGAGSKIAGKRAHISICDDLIADDDAYSPTVRNRINNWYPGSLRSRVLPGGSEIMVGTRWHLEDPMGFRIKADAKSKVPWKVIAIPAILDKKTAKLLRKPDDPEGFYVEGGSFWPQYQPLEWLLDKKNSPDMQGKWEALYQQNPVPDEGTVVKYNDWKLWKDSEPPPVNYIVASLDTAFSTSEKADYTAISIWGVFNREVKNARGLTMIVPNLILLACDRGRYSFPELFEKVKEINEEYEPDNFIIEKKGSGISLIQDLRELQLPIYEFDPKAQDKLTRLYRAQPYFTSGKVWVPSESIEEIYNSHSPCEWAKDLVDEVCGFPNAPKDDFCDTTVQTVLWMKDAYMLKHNYEPEEDEDEIEGHSQKPKSYWSSL